MAKKFTNEQQNAIQTDGSILVSAAAGSGKTSVLVERVFRLLTDPDHPLDADRLLVVTFTNAAAAEMRGRIEKRITDALHQKPNDKVLMRQRYLLSSAKICTIDSFCIDLVRENFSTVGIQPDFRMDDGDALAEIQQSVLDKLMDEQMKDNSSVFRDLLDVTDSEFDENNLKATILKVFHFSRNFPFPERYIAHLADCYIAPFDKNHLWWENTFRYLKRYLDEIEPAVAKLAILCPQDEFGAPILAAAELLQNEVSGLKTALMDNEWNIMVQILNADLPKIGQNRKADANPAIKVCKQLYSSLIAERDKLRKLFCFTKEEIARPLQRLKEPVQLFVQLTETFAERFFAEQCEENVFTFYNTEQLALSMLCRPDQDGIAVLPQAEELQKRFDAILVDEYQDTNDLQDLLFTILSDAGKRLFAVGDVKQSIYGFRGANSENFLQKRAICKPFGQAKADEPCEITLSNNFRSRHEICDFVNYFFENFMTQNTSSILYDKKEWLYAGATFPKTEKPFVEVQFYDGALSEKKEDGLLVEARGIAKTITRIMAEKAYVKSNDEQMRPACYGDIAILLPATKNKADFFANELRKYGIPVSLAEESFTETNEIATFSSLLKVLDNPKDDIALLTVLLSPMFSFTPEDIAQYRAAHQQGDLIAVLTAAAEKDERAESFLKRISFMRREATMLSIPKLITRLFALTDYPNMIALAVDGKHRHENLMGLIAMAESFSANGNGNLKDFITFVETHGKAHLSKKSDGGENAVRIMSMHGSKGLQFPICILANLNRRFYRQDSYARILFSRKNGMGIHYFEESEHADVTTFGHEVLANDLQSNQLEESLRLLYVAMTRAEERLIMVSYYQNLQNRIDKLTALLSAEDSAVGGLSFRAAASLADWLLMATMLHPDGEPVYRCSDISLLRKDTAASFVASISYPPEMEIREKTTRNIVIDTGLKEAVCQRLAYTYPYERLGAVEAKTTVSALANKAEGERFDFTERPAFLLKDGLSAAERGTAMHKVMQFLQIKENLDLSEELDRLCDWRFITEEERKALCEEDIRRFLSSPLFHRIVSAKWFRREMRFLTEIPAGRIDNTLEGSLANEPVVVQGAVDLCWILKPTVFPAKKNWQMPTANRFRFTRRHVSKYSINRSKKKSFILSIWAR